MKILITYVSAGAGHFKAAEALYLACQKQNLGEIHFVDALDYSNSFFKKSYVGTYDLLVARAPKVWGWAFGLIDINGLQKLYRILRRIFNFINARHLHRFLEEEQFDYIFSTHFMPTEVAAALKRSKKINSRLINIITDFDVHKIWLAQGVDCYVVASDWTKDKLKSLGVDKEQILVSGIPTDAKFAQDFDRPALKNKLGLKPDVFTVLVATGSFGIGPIAELASTLSEDKVQVILICGRNKYLFERFKKKESESLKVFGFVNNIHELMAVSDVMVTKPGGLSISEALVVQLPLIFFHPIPGQEANNAKVLNHYGVGTSAETINDVVEKLKSLRSSRDLFLSAVKKIKPLSHSQSAEEVLSIIKRI